MYGDIQHVRGAPRAATFNGCAGAFPGSVPFAKCTGNFVGCECSQTLNTCGDRQSCVTSMAARVRSTGACRTRLAPRTSSDARVRRRRTRAVRRKAVTSTGARASSTYLDGKAYCTRNFIGCQCTPTSKTCGNPQSCDKNNCAGAFNGNVAFPQCTNFFKGCQCKATSNTCGAPQSCGLNGCGGAFDLTDGKAYCTRNFRTCECKSNPGTCGAPQSCDKNNCAGAFNGKVPTPQCTNFFKDCQCSPTSTTCGAKQSCDLNGCLGGFDTKGVARCQGNFQGCECKSTSVSSSCAAHLPRLDYSLIRPFLILQNTCGTAQNCDLNGCNGSFDSNSNTARCRGNFAGCVCKPVAVGTSQRRL